jgi:hypothetical protein
MKHIHVLTTRKIKDPAHQLAWGLKHLKDPGRKNIQNRNQQLLSPAASKL